MHQLSKRKLTRPPAQRVKRLSLRRHPALQEMKAQAFIRGMGSVIDLSGSSLNAGMNQLQRIEKRIQRPSVTSPGDISRYFVSVGLRMRSSIGQLVRQ